MWASGGGEKASSQPHRSVREATKRSWVAYVFAIGVVADAISDAVHGDAGDGAIKHEPGKAALADECVGDVHAAVAVVVAALGGVARGLAARIGQHHVVDAAA